VFTSQQKKSNGSRVHWSTEEIQCVTCSLVNRRTPWCQWFN